jgi:hypothetical protein
MSGRDIQYTTLSGTLPIGGGSIEDSIDDASTVISKYDSAISKYDNLIHKFSTQEFVPYTFPDTFVMKSNAELSPMSLDEIRVYRDALEQNISSYTSTIYATQAVKTAYNIQQQSIRSVIQDIATDNITNTIQQARVRTIKDDLQNMSTNYISTLASYKNQLEYYSTVSSIEKSSILGYTRRSDDLKGMIDTDNRNYSSTLQGYSTISSLYGLYDKGYKEEYVNMMSTSTAYDKSVLKERSKYSTMIATNLVWASTSKYLSTLYNASTVIHSTVVQRRLAEYSSIKIYQSTTSAIEYYSSLYIAAVAKRSYNMAVSTQISTASNYMNTLSTYNGIKYLYLTSGSGGAPNSIITAAFALASKQLSTAILEQSVAESTVSTFQMTSTREADRMYNTLLRQYTRNVEEQQKRVYTYRSQKMESLEKVRNFCTIYDTQTALMLSSITSLAYYSSLYVSSLAGKSTLQSQYSTNNMAVITKMSTSDGYSKRISTLNVDYSNYNSSFIGWKNISAGIYSDVLRYMSNISSYSTLYNSSILGLSSVQSSILSLGGNVNSFTDTIFTESSLLLQDYIFMDQYQNNIRLNTNTQDLAAYKYKETCTRTKLLSYKQLYQDLVLSSIQMSSTFTGSTIQGLLNNNDTSYVANTMYPVDLNTPIITASYSKINTINTFLDVFAKIYDKYDKKNTDLVNLGTSIGNTLTAYNDFQPASLNAYVNPTNSALLQEKNTKLGFLIQAQNDVIRKKRTVADDDIMIQSTVSTLYLSTYKYIFSSDEISQQNSTISSFIISGFSTAIKTYFQQTGIVIGI